MMPVYINLIGSDIHRLLPPGKHRFEANDELRNHNILRKERARVQNVASFVPHGFRRLDSLKAEPVGYLERQRAHFGNIIVVSVTTRNNASYSACN